MRIRMIEFSCLPLLAAGLLLTSTEAAFAQAKARQVAAKPVQAAIAAPKYKLPPRMVNILTNDVMPALKAENDELFMESLLHILQKIDIDQHAEVEQFAFDNNLGSLREEFGKRIQQRVEQKLPMQLPQLTFPAAVFVNDYFMSFIDNEFEELIDHTVMQDPLTLPKSWKAREKVFWDVHVFKNRLLNIEAYSRFLINQNMRHYEIATRKSDQAMLDRLQPIDALPQRLADHRAGMMENEAALRLKQLRISEEALRQESTSFKDRISAAFAMDLDERALSEFYQKVDPDDVTRLELLADDTKTEIQSLLDSAKHYGADVIEKAVLLRHGAHFWLRGRYGLGPMERGLLKRPDAMDSEEKMFGLFMPKERNEPIKWVTAEGEITPGYKRRHYHTWAIERREFNGGKRVSSKVTSTGSKTGGGPLKYAGTKHFW